MLLVIGFGLSLVEPDHDTVGVLCLVAIAGIVATALLILFNSAIDACRKRLGWWTINKCQDICFRALFCFHILIEELLREDYALSVFYDTN